MEQEKNILFEELKGAGGKIGVITLNRPRFLNAITCDMCKKMFNMLTNWANDSIIKAVVIQGSGDKAFCAGGDIKHLYEKGKEREFDAIHQFFWEEYRLNRLIRHYPKPYIALLDGITMGGGVGVSIHGSHRIVTERFSFAMPETSIGFFPDIGCTYVLARCPGETGIYLGLTGKRLNAAEAIYLGLADNFISSNHLEEIVHILQKTKLNNHPYEIISETLAAASVTPEAPRLTVYRDIIDECFALDTVEEIINKLKEKNKEWANEVIVELEQKSPTSLKVSLHAFKQSVNMDFDACMRMEFRLSQRFLRSHDFYEGVRATLIDRDNTAQWQPDKLSDVSHDSIETFFSPLPSGELELD